MNYVKQIKERILISEIVMERVKLQKRGLNLLGHCPFHKEKTPSFTVNDDKQFYHCFGCGVHGDIFDFVMRFENITFMQALLNLSERAGIKITSNQRKKYYRYEILEISVKWFKQNLYKNKQALQYLQNRHIGEKCIQAFEIGFSPPEGVKNYLTQQGFTESQVADSGLITRNYKEYFYNRIILPIHDQNGRVIAFGGRTIISSTNQPKYLNSPESPIFKKNEIFYGSNLAKLERTESIIIVEGYFDVMILYQSGIKNVLALLGTALSVSHLQKLSKLYNELIICFDGDRAGKHAILKTIKLALSSDYSYKVKFVLLPVDKDPHDIIICDGVKMFNLLLQSRKTLSETLWVILSENVELSIPEEKIKLKNELFEYIKVSKDKEEFKYYHNFFTKKLYSVHKRRNNVYKLLSSLNTTSGEILIKIVLSYPQLLDNAAAEERFAKFNMETEKLSQIQDFIISAINSGQQDKLLYLSLNSQFSNEIKKILNNQHILQNKEQALALWRKLILIEEVQLLEKEYENEMKGSFNKNESEDKLNKILTRILELKSLLRLADD